MDKATSSAIIEFVHRLYPNESPIPLHAPRFLGNEKAYLGQCIDSTFVSYLGQFVGDFEEHVKRFTGISHAIAMVNGTSALQMALIGVGVSPSDGVITQALTFAATAAAIKHAGAEPIFVDVERATLSMNPGSLEQFLTNECDRTPNGLLDKESGRRIGAVVPMHTFGHPARIAEIASICEHFNIPLVEDAAESLGSRAGHRHTGTFGAASILSFNGNKTVTTGGGGMVITDDGDLAARIRHVSTTAKRKHAWEFFHDQVGYNYRMPNVNAAIGCAQMERLDTILSNKRETAHRYRVFFESVNIDFVTEPENCTSNYWLNAILMKDRVARDELLELTNANAVQTRPAWTLLCDLPPYRDCRQGDLSAARWLEDRLVCLPSSVRTQG
jgi:perosamine synthetase